MDHNYRKSKCSNEDPAQPPPPEKKAFIGEILLNQVRKEEAVGHTKEGITKVRASRATSPDESTPVRRLPELCFQDKQTD